MSTKSLGAGTRNITINVPIEDFIGASKLAGVSGASLSLYGRALIAYAVKYQLIAGENFEDRAKWLEALGKSEAPLPKVRLEIKAGPPQKLSVYSPETTPAQKAAETPPPLKKRGSAA